MSDNKKNTGNVNENLNNAKKKVTGAAKKTGNVLTRTAKSPTTWAFVSGLAAGAASVVSWQYFGGK